MAKQTLAEAYSPPGLPINRETVRQLLGTIDTLYLTNLPFKPIRLLLSSVEQKSHIHVRATYCTSTSLLTVNMHFAHCTIMGSNFILFWNKKN